MRSKSWIVYEVDGLVEAAGIGDFEGRQQREIECEHADCRRWPNAFNTRFTKRSRINIHEQPLPEITMGFIEQLNRHQHKHKHENPHFSRNHSISFWLITNCVRSRVCEPELWQRASRKRIRQQQQQPWCNWLIFRMVPRAQNCSMNKAKIVPRQCIPFSHSCTDA